MEKKVLLPGRIGADVFASSFFNESYLIKNAVDAEGHKVIHTETGPFTIRTRGGEDSYKRV